MKSRNHSKHPRAKLTPASVRYIRNKARDSTVTLAELARKFGVSAEVIRRVMNGRSYKDVS